MEGSIGRLERDMMVYMELLVGVVKLDIGVLKSRCGEWVGRRGM